MKRRHIMFTSRFPHLLFASLLILMMAFPAFTQNASMTVAPAQTSNSPQPSSDASPSTDSVNSASPTPSEPGNAAPMSAPSQEQDDRLAFMQEGRTEAETAPSAGGLLARTFGALLLIVGLIIGVGYGLRRFGGARFGATETDAPNLKVVASVALGERRSLAVVRFGSRTLLVGSTPQSLTLLASEDDNPDSPSLPARSVADLLRDESSSQVSFSDELLLAGQHQDSSGRHRLLDAPAQSSFAHLLPQATQGELQEEA